MNSPGLHVLAFLAAFAGTTFLGIGGFLWSFQIEKTEIDGEEMDLDGAKLLVWAGAICYLVAAGVWLAAQFL